MVKKILIFAGVVAVLLILAIAALPFWLSFAVRPVLNGQGVKYDSYERIGYNRLALTDLVYESDGIRVEAERVEGFMPLAWLWKRWRGADEEVFAEVENWRVEILEAEAKKSDGPAKEPVSVHEIVGQVEEIVGMAIDWVPRVRIGEGEVALPDRTIEVSEVRWNEGEISAEIRDRTLEQTVNLAGDLRDGLPYELRAVAEPFPLEVGISVERDGGKIAVRSEVELAGNPVFAEADFSKEGSWPERAVLRADRFRLPPELAEIQGYREIVGDVRAEWSKGRYAAKLRAEAKPDSAEGQFPPLQVAASASGDLESVLVEKLDVVSAWMTANLSDPVEIGYDGEMLSGESVFRVAADLAEQPFVEATGLLSGEVRATPGENRLPVVGFGLDGTDLAGFGVEIRALAAEGVLRWPVLDLAKLELFGADGTEFRASAAGVDFEENRVESGKAAGTVLPGIAGPWLPENVGFSAVDFSVEFSGPFAEIEHDGEALAREVSAPDMRVFDGEFIWSGRSDDLRDFALEMTAGEGRLFLRGESELEGKALDLVLEEFRLERAGEAILAAEGVTRVAANWADAEGATVSLDRLRWVGENGLVEASAEIGWPEAGKFAVRMEGLKPELLRDFVELSETAFDLRRLEAEGNWAGGPLAFRVGAEASFEVEGEAVAVEVDAEGAEESVRIDRLRATGFGEVLAVAEGVLPIYFEPGGERVFHFRDYGDVSFHASTEPETRFWEWLGNATGLRLSHPDLTVDLGGTPYAPVGKISGTASRIHLERVAEEQALPVLENLRIAVGFDVDAIRLDEASLAVEGQTVRAAAALPMGAERWENLVREREFPDWREASGELRIEEAQIAEFAKFFPTLLSRQGTLDADVRILPGLMLDGGLTVTNLGTRPLLPLGSIQGGTARIAFEGRTAKVEEISGLLGGERVLVTGEIDLPVEQELAFEMRVSGENIPLARRPGLILRSNLDLRIVGNPGETPRISGSVGLRDSFYLANLRLMPTGAVATPERRPPFFTVAQEPFDEWILDVELRGPEFLTVRGSIFRGTISAIFHLEGTLEEPRAIGSVTIDSGQIRFPFAAMDITQGEVMLTPENPYRPQLFVVATSRTFGYDLRMEVTGTADEPVIEFTSNPPLTSEEALLMVSAGELPREEGAFTTQQKASKFAVYIGQNLLYQITGDDTAAERLIIRSGEYISEQGRETMSVEYKLTEDWSIVGEYDRFDDYNAGLKWNIYTR